MTGMDEELQIDEIVVKKQFDVNAALESIQFYWNLARFKGEGIVVKLFRERKIEGNDVV